MASNSGSLRMTSSGLTAYATLSVLILLFCGPPMAHGFFGEWGPDLAGPWCAKRAPGTECCDGRDDYCGVPILGTECYCDIFCNLTAYDCCPDYWSFCHGKERQQPTTTLPPPRSTRPPVVPCYRNGQVYMPGESIKDNCNTCICKSHQFGSEFECTTDVCLVRPELIQELNDGTYTWSATNYSKFWGMTLDEGVRYRLGTFLLPGDVLRMTPLRVEDDLLPTSFDARQKWANILSPIRDQGDCASSWAHSTTAVASDRLAIETDGAIKVEMSPQMLLSCNTNGQLGCKGGHLDRAWVFLRHYGVVTEECYPYTSGQTDEAGECFIPRKQKGVNCPSGLDYKSNARYKATPPYRIRPQEREIMKEIMDNGPVQATILVHEDFFMYRQGIYSHASLIEKRGDPEEYIKSGFHSVRIIGWGSERRHHGDLKYWIVANSWGEEWGEGGYFRIARGTDESRIERYVVGVWGKISGDNHLRGVLMDNRRRRQRGQRARQLRDSLTRRSRRRRHNRHQHRSFQDRPQAVSHQLSRFQEYKYNKAPTKTPHKYNHNKHKTSNHWNKWHKMKKQKQHKKHVSKFYNSDNLEGLYTFFPGLKY